jgi:hypothetical protein
MEASCCSSNRTTCADRVMGKWAVELRRIHLLRVTNHPHLKLTKNVGYLVPKERRCVLQASAQRLQQRREGEEGHEVRWITRILKDPPLRVVLRYAPAPPPSPRCS